MHSCSSIATTPLSCVVKCSSALHTQMWFPNATTLSSQITILFNDELQLATLIVQELIVEWINRLRAPQHLFKVMLERSYKIHIMNNGTLLKQSRKHENNGQKVLFKGKTVWWTTWIWEKVCVVSNGWDRQIGNLRFFVGTNWRHVSLAQQAKGFVLEEISRWHSKVWWYF